MHWIRMFPVAVVSLLLSTSLGLALYFGKVTDFLPSVLASVLLELVLVQHATYSDVRHLSDPSRGLLWRMPELSKALAMAGEISTEKNVWAALLVRSTIARFASRIHDIRHATLECSPSEFMDFAESIYKAMKKGDHLRATSHLAGGDYWKHKYGEQYERMNRDAAARGALIERVYMLRDAAHLNEVRPILDRQKQFSVVRYVLLDGIDSTMDLSRRDFFVLNKQLTVEFHFVQPNNNIDHISIMADTGMIDSMDRAFRRLWGSALEYK